MRSCIIISEGQLESRLSLAHLFLQPMRKPNYPLSALHSVEVTSAAVGISSHPREAKPVSHFQAIRNCDALCDDVHAVAGHAKESGVGKSP